MADATAPATAGEDAVPGVALDADRYTVRQSLIRNKYAVYDPDGTLVLRAKQKLLKMKEEFPFVNADDEPVFRVKAQNVFDIAGDYTLTAEDGEPIAVLEKQFTFFKHVWRVRGPDDRLYATIESGSTVVEALRNFSALFGLIPHSYTITGPGGERIGSIEGRFSLRDVYDIEIHDTGDVPREAIVAACIAVDALEGN
jgi:uncharacterized protein YxjI